MSNVHDSGRPVLLWFRKDLRLADQAAVNAALETGQPVLPVFILDDEAAGPWTNGGASRWWLHHSLASLNSDLNDKGARLILRRGSTTAEISRLVDETGATAIFTGGPYEPWARHQDHLIADDMAKRDIELHRLRTTTLFNPDAVRTKAGRGYTIYTPFAQACRALGDPRPPTPAPARIKSPHPPRSDRVTDWELTPTKPDWADGLRENWTPGEAGALKRLNAFASRDLASYAEGRDRPGSDATSRLSPHLHHGEISAAQVWHEIHRARPGNGRETFIRELLWREFCFNLLWHNSGLPDSPLRPEFGGMPWRDDPAGLRAWQQGRTGLPIVDAGMRQLWQIGWMHNRVRMIVASFLIKHLMIPWQKGEAWFWDTLVDADLANNAANWQWVAGCGADAAPYFRIFNPVLQGRRFDPGGDYVRQFVPELARLDARHIQAPWAAPEAVLRQAGVRLGETYPHPIVDLATGRGRALEAYARIRTRA